MRLSGIKNSPGGAEWKFKSLCLPQPHKYTGSGPHHTSYMPCLSNQYLQSMYLLMLVLLAAAVPSSI